MRTAILNSKVLLEEVSKYIREELTSEDHSNNQVIKTYFGARQYDKQQIEYKSVQLHTMLVSISDNSPYYIKIINGTMQAIGVYRIESGNGVNGKGFGVNVSYSVEIDPQNQSFKGLQFSS